MYWCVCFCGLLATIATSRAMDAETEEALERMQEVITTLTHQVMMQQLTYEEKNRGDGSSGIKRMRTHQVGTKAYYGATHVDAQVMGIHDHSNFRYTIGLGEFTALLNGIEFRTRHNDYMMLMKSKTSSEYGATEEVPLPEVPPAVLALDDPVDQAAEMREWFKAWRDQDYSVRDYRPYFTATLCYLEGMWTHSDADSIDESFESDRHSLNAKTWHELTNKLRFSSYSGAKDQFENLAFLPTSIFNLRNGTIPETVQWNYRILCHPLKRNLPLNRIGAVDDLKTRVAHGMSFSQYKQSRAARFQLNSKNSHKWADKDSHYLFLDELMEEIPSAGNYPEVIEDDLNFETVYPLPTERTERLNTARYHRVYRVESFGASGLRLRRRGFSDENMFLAETTNKKVAGLSTEACLEDGTCKTWHKRWCYAIPLEIVYLTPLLQWNPYNIDYKGKGRDGDVIYDGPNGRRDGSASPDKAYNGTNSRVYYRTPLDFFENMTYVDAADTTQEHLHVLDAEGNVRAVRASGTRIILPNIPDVGSLRTRYVIAPVHGEGSPVWKELAAIKEALLYPTDNRFAYPVEVPMTTQAVDVQLLEEKAEMKIEDLPADYSGTLRFETQVSTNTTVAPHTHTFEFTGEDTQRYLSGEMVTILTNEMHGHSHELQMQIGEWASGKVNIAKKCDGKTECWDGHNRKILLLA